MTSVFRNIIYIVFCLSLCGSANIVDQATWVDNTYMLMSDEEKIGQLIMIRAHSDLGLEHINDVKKQIKKYHVGGLCFFQGTPEKQAELSNSYQSISKLPLMVSMDAEWGLGMRLKESAISFPKAMMLGAITDNRLIEEMGIEIGRQMRSLGVQVNFAPVVDINNNPENPVINYRSFGENRHNVAAKSLSYMRGLQKSRVLACAKHFPGHGDTATDSHYDLPVISHNRHRLDSIELYPFKVLSKNGVGSMMVAHLQIPAFDDQENRPTTLSTKSIEGVLKKYIGFDGLIFTDALEMKGVANHFAPGVMEVEALRAGNDVLLLPIDIEKAVRSIKQAIKDGVISWESIEYKVKKVLRAKYHLGLHSKPFIDHRTIRKKINTQKALALKMRLIQNALTLVQNDNGIVPISNLNQNIATLSIGATKKTSFQEQIDLYAKTSHFNIGKEISTDELEALKTKLESFDNVILSVHDMSSYASKNFGLTNSMLNAIESISSTKETCLIVFGSPYSLASFNNQSSIIVAYNDEEETQRLTAQGLFGAFSFKGRLPVSSGTKYSEGQGIVSSSLLRLSYAIPESVGMNSDSLLAIDTIVEEMILEQAAPGCQVLVAKEGKIVYHKSFGHHTFKKKRKVLNTDIYDVASITKVMASTISLMKLSDQGKLKTDKAIVDYISERDTTNKAGLILNDILAHHAGLAGWIPFYRETQSDDEKPKILDKYYRRVATDSFPIKVAEDLFLRFDYPDSIYAMIYNNDLKENRNYRYSDLGFYMFHEIINRISGQPLDEFASTHFYNPLGLQRTCFKPMGKHPLECILPTEEDDYFRNQKVQGFVHDMGAAMLGGVSGHAGLFSTANDLAILGQMLLNGGYYGGQQYLKPETIKKFSTRHPRSTRRGLGFDMKQLDEEKTLNMSEAAGEKTFGHLGFTGTAIWIDPDEDLIYVFLSNRTYPSMNNRKFSNNEYRPRIQTVLYNALN